jgi:hypothetical protein
MVGDDMDVNFSSIDELKKRLMPALRLRKRELKRKNYSISEEEIWNYCIDNFWKKAVNLSLSQMVDDILNQEIILKETDIL